jgi:hypothetical protein
MLLITFSQQQLSLSKHSQMDTAFLLNKGQSKANFPSKHNTYIRKASSKQ